jgi:GNAT superfamily N-acetyltransferase
VKLTYKKLTHEDNDEIVALYKKTEDYFLLAEGGLAADSHELLTELPPDTSADQKTVIGAYNKGHLIGLIDCVDGYPDGTTCMLGLLLVDQAYRKRGTGRMIFQYAVMKAKEKGMTKMRIGVFEGNTGAYTFWTRLGFNYIETKGPMAVGDKEHMIKVLEYVI